MTMDRKDHAASVFWEAKHKDPTFLKERDAWYAKLAQEGHKDLEMIDPQTREPSRNMLKGMSPGDLYRGLYKPASEDFYRLCRQHRWQMESVGTNAVETRIWDLYSEGASVSVILDKLNGRTHMVGGVEKPVSRGYIKWVIQYETRNMMARQEREIEKAFAEEQADGT